MYDLPKELTDNEADELFEDLRKAGARIKYVNVSTNSEETTVLAIFCSPGAADRAVNSTPSSKFKLRPHQNTGGFAHADSNVPISFSS